MSLSKIRKKGIRFAIGLSCGASCRGVDAALVRIKGSGPSLHMKLLKYQRFPYSQGLKNRLMSDRKTGREISLLNFELGDKLANTALEMSKTAHEELAEVDFFALQGHSVAHIPPRGPDSLVGALQIGEPSLVAERLEMPVVSDMHVRDLAAGGQGNPLNAYADWSLFSREDRTMACLHLSTVATLNVIPPDFEEVMGFDVGPANMAIDGAMRLLTSGSHTMDRQGKAAAKGVVIDEFLEYLLDHHYFNRVPPKCTGKEEFGPELYLRDALSGRKNHSMEDLVATVTAAVGYSISRAYNRFIKPRYSVSRLIVSGGGVDNRTLMHHVKKGVEDVVVRVSDEYGLPHDALDACSMAILGNETICGKPSNVPQATGARYPVKLGRITLG